MSQPTDAGGELKKVRDEIQFENGMLASRLSAYLTSQSFLVIAFAGSAGAGWTKPGVFLLLVPLPLALLGLMLSFDALRMMQSSFRVIARWHARQFHILSQRPPGTELWWSDGDEMAPSSGKANFRLSSRFSQHTPWLFGVCWIYLACVTIYLHAVYG